MILSGLIIILFILAWLHGWHRGLVQTIIMVAGTVIVYFLAVKYNGWLSHWVIIFGEQLSLVIPGANHWLLKLIIFLLTLAVGTGILHRLSRLARSITWLPFIRQVNGLLGGVIAIAGMYLVISFILVLGVSFGNQTITDQYQQSNLAQALVKVTPTTLTDQLPRI